MSAIQNRYSAKSTEVPEEVCYIATLLLVRLFLLWRKKLVGAAAIGLISQCCNSKGFDQGVANNFSHPFWVTHELITLALKTFATAEKDFSFCCDTLRCFGVCDFHSERQSSGCGVICMNPAITHQTHSWVFPSLVSFPAFSPLELHRFCYASKVTNLKFKNMIFFYCWVRAREREFVSNQLCHSEASVFFF